MVLQRVVQVQRGGLCGRFGIHLWQQCSPVVTEALVQLTWGGPQVIYHGGLRQARVRYYDGLRRRPGLPASVAALVSGIDPAGTVVEAVRYTACPDGSWLGDLYDYGHGEPDVTEYHADVRGSWLPVRMAASTRIRLTLTMAMRTRDPSYATPFDADRAGLTSLAAYAEGGAGHPFGA